MRKNYLILVFILAQVLLKGQSAPNFITNYGAGFSAEAIYIDTANIVTIVSEKTGSNNTSITKRLSVNSVIMQGNYNVTNIMDTVKSIKYDGNRIFVCTSSSIIAISDIATPTVNWTCSNTSTDIPSYSLPSGTSKRFLDMDLRNDTIFALYSDNIIRPLMINKNTGVPFSYAGFYPGNYIVHNNATCRRDAKIKVYGNKIYVYGNIQNNLNGNGLRLFSFDIPFGNYSESYPIFYGNTANNLGFVNDIEFYNGKVYVGGSFRYVNSFGNIRKSFAMFDQTFNLLGDTLSYSVFNATTELQGIHQFEVYGNLILAKGVYWAVNNTLISGSVTPQYNLSAFNLHTRTFIWNIPFAHSICSKGVLETGDLYMHHNIHPDLTINGAKAYHLPPKTYGNHILYPGGNSLSTNSVLTICSPNNGSITFTAPIQYHCHVGTQAPNNNSWSYSGTGVTIIPGPFGKTAQLNISASATSGTLSVVGVNSGGTSAQTSEVMKLYINVLPKPTVTASFVQMDTVSCKKPKIAFTVSVSPTTVFTPTWTCPDLSFKYNFSDSTKYKMGGYYKATVMGMNGCIQRDSVFAKVDTIKPNVTLPVSQVYIKCDPDSSLLQGSSTTTNTAIWWRKSSAPAQYFQPFYTKTIGNYYIITKNNQNGCKDSLAYQVLDKTMLPNAYLTSHTYSNPVTPIDTVTCLQPTINVVAASDTANTSIQWRQLSSPSFSANPINVTQQGNFKLYVQRSDNGCVDSSKIVFVAQYNSLPGVSIVNENHIINCSYYTVNLTGNTTNTNAVHYWQTPSSSTLTNPTSVAIIGDYILHTTDTINGCEKLDTVSVTSTNQLVVNAGSNLKACKNSLITLSASVIGTLSPISYSWSEGSTGQSISTSTSITTDYIVTVNGPSGCSGSDTLKLIIPSDIVDSLALFQNCDNTPFGTITFYAQGGTPPYQYSINNGTTFNSLNTFTQIPFGTYPLIIKDSLGCAKSNSATLNGNSNLPIPKFIASTFNFSKDTIVLVDLSNPRPDSVEWVLPIGMQKVGGNIFNPVIAVNDTGNFTVTMRSFYGTCVLQTTKIVRFKQSDSSYANNYNSNGIKSLNVYPNPNTGLFTVDIEFYKKQNFSIQVWDNLAHQHYYHNAHESDHLILPVDVTQLINGTYILKIVGEYDSRNQLFIISK